MPVTHLIHTILRPGVQSIQVQYKYRSAEVWTNYSEGQRIPGGVDVKFTVTTYTNFTLTEWKAYYADEYDDTVNIQLTGITGESAWTFTLPGADVYIRCEAESSGPPVENYPEHSSDFSPFVITGTLTATQLIDKLNEINPDECILPYSAISSIESFLGNNVGYLSVSKRETNNIFGIVRVAISQGAPHTWGEYVPYSSERYRISFDGANVIIGEYYETTYGNLELEWGAYSTPYNPGTGYVAWNSVGYKQGAYNGKAIRYIMSPENSGEVDASAPSELEQGTTEFTFKWRIKSEYEFKRLTPFAVGEGTLEDDVVYSLQYDGNTRTYTFTVSSIPNWAIGMRVIIETIMTGDPSSAIGNNSSDGPIGGKGTFDDSSDEVPLPAIPEGVSAPDSGFVTLFRPTISQIKDLSNYMWSNLSEFIENLQKIFTNPMDYIISLASFPVTPDVGPNKNIYVGNFLTNIQMPPITRQFYEFNCGTVSIAEYFGSFLDYAPNTRARIMLPFIGDADLSINEIMGKTLHLWYRIDLLSGSCVAVLTIDNSVYYQWTGNCSIQIPVTASDFSRLYAGIARVGVTAAAVAAGGAYLGALASAASGWNNANAGWHGVIGDSGQGYSPSPNFGTQALPPSYGQLSTDFYADRGPQLNMSDYLSYTPPMQIPSKKSRALAAAAGGSFIGHNIMNAVPRVQHAGGMSGNIGIMGNRTPFIVLEYPNVSMPENYKHVFGYPSNMYKVLGNLAGYTKCKQVLFESTKTTDDEYEMVIEALKGGVYL